MEFFDIGAVVYLLRKAIDPDDFLLDQLDLYPGLIMNVLRGP